ncbi:hypothetical protein IID22_03565 [Patescibacteria group bacterium]|nr:hypothetical protein [Patescibacteria group bacterium]
MTPNEPAVIENRRQKILRIESFKNGFCIRPGESAQDDEFPVECTVRVAYDVLVGSPFRRYDALDFDLGKCPIVVKNETLLKAEKNILVLTLDSKDFSVSATGFDDQRDIALRAATREIE